MIAINSALAVDLTGQVAADTLRRQLLLRHRRAGRLRARRRAQPRRQGRSSRCRRPPRTGTVSRIQAALEEGAGVVTSRGDVRYVVTEYGVADLWGKNIRERALALIDDRPPRLPRASCSPRPRQRRYVFAGPGRAARRAIPGRRSAREQLPDGHERARAPGAHHRRAGAAGPLLRALRREHLPPLPGLQASAHPHEEMQQLVDLDYEHNMALVALDAARASCWVSPLRRRSRHRAGGHRLLVRDDWQGRGLGTLLMRRMAEIAHARGIAGFCADVLASNVAMLRVFHRSGHHVTSTLDAGVYSLEVRLNRDAFDGAAPRTREGAN